MFDGPHDDKKENDSSHQAHYIIVLQKLQSDAKDFSTKVAEY